MRAMDFAMPWGRAPEDAVALKRVRAGRKAMARRLANTQAVTDSSAPRCLKMAHLDNRLKKKALAEERRLVIKKDNDKLVESMARVLRGQRESVFGSPPKRLLCNPQEHLRRVEAERIEFENRLMADRLRGTLPTLSAAKHKEHYKKSTEIRHNLSKAYKKEVRAKKYQKWLEMNGREPDGSMPSMAHSKSTPAFSDEGQDSPGFVDETQMTTSMSKLRTAKEVRKLVAEERGLELPNNVITSQTMPPKKSSGNKYGQYRFQMDHTGFDFRSQAPPALPLKTEVRSPSGPEF